MNPDLVFGLIKELASKEVRDMIKTYKKDQEEAKRIKKNFLLDERGVLYFKKQDKDEKPRRVIIGTNGMKEVLREYHDEPLGGHLGIDNTIEKIKKVYYWPQMSKDIENYVRSCIVCQKRKVRREETRLNPITREPEPFKHIGIDIMGPLPPTDRGKRYIVLAIDLFTKWIEAKPIEEADAQTISTFIYEDIICRHGVPERMTSDRGTEFVNDLIRTLTKQFKIKHIMTTAYHPQGNGQTERANQTVKNTLAKITKKGRDWDLNLPAALFVTRTMTNDSTKFTPSELIYGRIIRRTADDHISEEDISRNTSDDTSTEKFVDLYLEQVRNMKEIREKAHEFIKKAQIRQKKAHDKAIKLEAEKLKIGDRVLVYRSMIEQNWSAKLEPKWDGPYRIQDIKGTTIWLRDELHHSILPRTFHRTRLKKLITKTSNTSSKNLSAR